MKCFLCFFMSCESAIFFVIHPVVIYLPQALVNDPVFC